jgi:peptidoglycan/xylan/chitin deacetylase (PgdA/CDA1 family)
MKRSIVVTLNFDDFHPQSGPDGDFGGDPQRGTLRMILDLLEEFPALRVTLFAVPSWTDRPYRMPTKWYHLKRALGFRPVVKGWDGEPFRLDKHREWCDAVRNRSAAGRLELAVHGLHHHNPNLVIHGQEFLGLEKEETRRRISQAEKIFEEVRLPFVKGFRAPGWGYGAETLRALADAGYDFVGLFGSPYQLSKPGLIEGMVVIPQNYSIKDSPDTALAVALRDGVVHAKGHTAYRYGREVIENGLSPEHFENLRRALRALGEQYEVRYLFLSEYAREARAQLSQQA